ncbi:MAG TPA: extracellular solute-binding protein [Anaerolineales bacterium]|nr:extracellular solute-binding protein [Anaerolineales bacterium]
MKGYYKVIVLFVLLALILPACGGAQPAGSTTKDYLNMSWDDVVKEAKAEKEMVFYMWWGEEYWKTAAQKFEEKYGIKVNVVIGDNNVDKLLAEKDSAVGTIDAQAFGGESVKTIIDGGLLYGPILPKMPGVANLDAKLGSYQEGVETKGYLVPLYRNQTGFLYDPDKISNPPQTWEDLVKFVQENPKQFAFCDPNKGGTGQAMVFTSVVNLTGGLDQYKADKELDQAKAAKWSAVWDWFNANKDNYMLTASNNESLDLLNQGAVSLIIAWDDDTQIAFSKGTIFKRAKMYIPQMGLPGGGDSVGIPKNAPHKAAALLFIDFLTSPEMQKEMNSMIGSYPARTDVATENALLPEDQRQKYGLSWYPAPYKAYGNEMFTKEVLMK